MGQLDLHAKPKARLTFWQNFKRYRVTLFFVAFTGKCCKIWLNLFFSNKTAKVYLTNHSYNPSKGDSPNLTFLKDEGVSGKKLQLSKRSNAFNEECLRTMKARQIPFSQKIHFIQKYNWTHRFTILVWNYP